MPEGDTIHTLARALREDLVGRRLERVELHGRPVPSLAVEVVSVEARGKNLLLSLASGEVLRVHLGMHGDWHRYPRDAPSWRKAAWRASLSLRTGEATLVCFDAEELEFLEADRLSASRRLRDLGPDLISEETPAGRLVERARSFQPSTAPVVDLLLDQRVAAGIGNVYKSELLFLRRIAPLTPVGDLEDAELATLYELAARLLRANVGGGSRTTTRERGARGSRRPRLWVYGRAGEPCLRCGEAVVSARLGRGRRSTYWCRRCQQGAPGAEPVLSG
ncbi:MAG TPA: DNA-formamidopyrimidine glycosylase family protein [Thermoanaerobaculia bacterium]|nr:DNA-formamidopyrimidine glycosylase family protein [Thermoanaerobaculia bacterium]